jgi:hypothetical protein
MRGWPTAHTPPRPLPASPRSDCLCCSITECVWCAAPNHNAATGAKGIVYDPWVQRSSIIRHTGLYICGLCRSVLHECYTLAEEQQGLAVETNTPGHDTQVWEFSDERPRGLSGLGLIVCLVKLRLLLKSGDAAVWPTSVGCYLESCSTLMLLTSHG